MLVIVGADDTEYRLMRDLLRNYDRRVRPSLNASEPLNVTFGLALAQIIDVVRHRLVRWCFCVCLSVCLSVCSRLSVRHCLATSDRLTKHPVQ